MCVINKRFRSVVQFYPDLILVMTALTVWTASYQFAEKLGKNLGQDTSAISRLTKNTLVTPSFKRCPWFEIYGCYQVLRQLCVIVNQTFGLVITLYLAIYLVYQSTSIDQIMVEPDIWSQIKLIFFVVSSTSFLLLSADACDKVMCSKLMCKS